MKNEYRVNGETTTIYIDSIKHGKFEVFVDTEDLSKVKQVNSWYVRFNSTSDSFYVFGHMKVNNKLEIVQLHRLIFDLTDPKEQVDHIYHNTLDNRKRFLRIVSNYENQQNARKNKRNTSGITGVSWNKKQNKWRSYINVNGKEKHLGSFSNIKDAKKSRLNAEQRYWHYKTSLTSIGV